MLLASLDMQWFSTLMLIWVFVFGVYHYWSDLFSRPEVKPKVSFMGWLLKGLGGASSCWLLLNCDLFRWMPPLHPEAYEAVRSSTTPVSSLLNAIRPTFSSIGSVWCLLSFIWMIAVIFAHHCDRKRFWIQTATWSFFCLPIAGVLMLYGGGEATPYAVIALLLPVTHVTLDGVEDRAPRPMYARAIARMKLGKYGEAEQEVIEQLEKCEDDIEGWLLLAELYACRFKELPEADRTIRELCNQPNVSEAQATVALHKLADWHLEIGEDPASARMAIQEILTRFPGTHFARMAEQRIQRLPSTANELREQSQPKPIRLPSLRENAADDKRSTISKADAHRRNEELVARLKRNPNNPEPREELVDLLAGPLQKPELAVEQLELLIQMPDLPDARKAEWMARIASLLFNQPSGEMAGRESLDRLIRAYPSSPQARAARRKLQLLDREKIEKQAAASNAPQPIRIRVEIPGDAAHPPSGVRS